jgi:hypothetical protein
MESTELDLSKARVPSPTEISMRKNLLWQALRFAILNLKMVKMITKGHTGDQ